MTADTRPCACGRDGCTVTRREGESAGNFRQRKYASDRCRWWAKQHRPPAPAATGARPARDPLDVALEASGLPPLRSLVLQPRPKARAWA